MRKQKGDSQGVQWILRVIIIVPLRTHRAQHAHMFISHSFLPCTLPCTMLPANPAYRVNEHRLPFLKADAAR